MLGKWWFLSLSLGFVAPSQASGQTNGLEGQDRDMWYHLSQGTEFFPLDFLRALQDADTGEPFMRNLERFGFVPDQQDARKNPYGLPVGMAADTTRDLRFKGVIMIGINCAACHTAAFEFGGLPVLRADGGTNMFDADGFRFSLMASVQKTIDDPRERLLFVSRLLRQSASVKRDLLTDLTAKRLGERMAKILDAVGGPEKVIADRFQGMIGQKLRNDEPIDLLRGMLTPGVDDKTLREAKAKIEAKVQWQLSKGAALPNPEVLFET